MFPSPPHGWWHFAGLTGLIGLVSIAVLARLLTPADFGVVGYALLVIGLLELFTEVSTDVELIRNKLTDHSYYSAAWTMNVLRGLAIGILMVALTLPAAGYFHEDALVPIMLALVAVPGDRGLRERRHRGLSQEP